jgi:hypothetical protein
MRNIDRAHLDARALYEASGLAKPAPGKKK